MRREPARRAVVMLVRTQDMEMPLNKAQLGYYGPLGQEREITIEVKI